MLHPMPDRLIRTPANGSATLHSISRSVCQAIVSTRQQHPEWLKEKVRNYSWQSGTFQSKLTDKIAEELSHCQDRDALIRKLLKILQSFLKPSFLVSEEFERLTDKLRQVTQEEIETSWNSRLHYKMLAQPAGTLTPEVAQNGYSSSAGEPVAILLLDAENLQLDAKTEKFLAGICAYPIQIKIAFANWRSMGKQDDEFHRRHYELIHVPPGKDSADVKMATVGSSIFVHYPTAKEVLVCSSDTVLLHLCTTLQTHGLTVYLVRKQRETITVLNSKTGKTQTHSLVPVPEIPSIEELIIQLKNLIKAEQTRSQNSWFKLSEISQIFQEKYQLNLSQVVSAHWPTKRAKDIFTDNPADFVVHQPAGKSDILYVTLFEIPTPHKGNRNDSPQLTEASTEGQPSPAINSKAELEKALAKLVGSLTAKSPERYVSVSKLGSEFNKKYGKTLKDVLADLQLNSKVTTFLQSSKAFNLKQVGNMFLVAVAQER
jgi:O6-methylguanine-DNA--protein-cysteine methyltransferase